jgi:hypothetical protein
VVGKVPPRDEALANAGDQIVDLVVVLETGFRHNGIKVEVLSKLDYRH